MKKVALSLAGVMAAATFAPQASALPVFARQTGMACNACHFQHFPLLNSFGRSFKASGFTLMGAEGKVEGQDLSIPDTLNLAVLTTAGYTQTNSNKATAAAKNLGARFTGDGAVYVPGTNGEFSLFVGGRVSDFAGALAELGQVGGAALSSAKVPILFDMGNGTRAGVVPFTTDGQTASYGFEELNTGANPIHISTFAAGDFGIGIGGVVSAMQYLYGQDPAGGAATGAAIVGANSMGFVNLTAFHRAGPADLGGNGAELGSTYLRVAGTFDMAGWDTGAGIQIFSGKSLGSISTSSGAITGATQADTKATAVDFQMQGEAGGMPLGIYASYATAPKSSATKTNAFNGNTGKARTALTVSADLGVVPEKATVEAAMRMGKTGASANNTDNAVMIGGTYKLAQNMMLQLTYITLSGNANKKGASQADDGVSTTQTNLNLTTLF